MRILLPLMALAAAGGLVAVGFAPETRSEVAPPRKQAKPDPVAEAKPEPDASPFVPPAADLVPIRALLQPGALPPQVRLTMYSDLKWDTPTPNIIFTITLDATKIGDEGHDGWAAYNPTDNTTHYVGLWKTSVHHSSMWVYGIVRGRGLPRSVLGSHMGLRMGAVNHPAPVPLFGGYMVGRSDMPPYSGHVRVE